MKIVDFHGGVGFGGLGGVGFVALCGARIGGLEA